MPHTQPGPATAVQIDIEPKPSTQHSYGNTVLASPWMGGGKTTAKREYQKELIRESQQMHTLDLDCNKVYSTSNTVNLKTTAAELRTEGLAHVTAAPSGAQSGCTSKSNESFWPVASVTSKVTTKGSRAEAAPRSWRHCSVAGAPN